MFLFIKNDLNFNAVGIRIKRTNRLNNSDIKGTFNVVIFFLREELA